MTLFNKLWGKENYLPQYNRRGNFNTNAESYYKYLERVNEILKIMAKMLDEQDEKLDDGLQEIRDTLQDYINQLEIILSGVDDYVVDKMVEWLNDGTLEHIINHEIFQYKLDTVIFEQFEVSINQLIAETEYGLQEQIQTLDSDLNEDLNDIIKHRPIYVGEEQPVTSIGSNGDMYVQLYGVNEPQLNYSQGSTSFTMVDINGDVMDGMETITNRGSWLKIGELVMVDLDISFNKNNYTGVNTLFRFRGLPFKPKHISATTIAEYSGFISPYNVTSFSLLTATTGLLVPRFTRVVETDGVNKFDILGVNPSNMSEENRITATLVYRTDENE